MTEEKKPKVNSAGQKELDKAEQQFKQFDESVKTLTQDRMNMAPKEDQEPQTKMGRIDIEKSRDIYLKPTRSLSVKDKFNEDYREDWNYAKEYVQFIAEHKEIIGDNIEMWTKPFAGVPAEFWNIPTNKPVWGPRYLAEQIKKCSYHRLKTEDRISTGADHMGAYTGQLVVDTTVQRLDAMPVSKRKSIFMGASTF